jgi:hypothetical protein
MQAGDCAAPTSGATPVSENGPARVYFATSTWAAAINLAPPMPANQGSLSIPPIDHVLGTISASKRNNWELPSSTVTRTLCVEPAEVAGSAPQSASTSR